MQVSKGLFPLLMKFHIIILCFAGLCFSEAKITSIQATYLVYLQKFNKNIKEVFDYFELQKELPVILINRKGEYVIN